MSKMLRAGELGWGLMVEGDAGYISSDLNKDILNEDFKIKPNEPVLVNCILQKWGVKNKNGRIYPKDVLVSQANLYMDLVNSNSAVSEADHPECVSASESMIYTKQGWKKFDDILDDEEILTLNIDTNQIEIQKIERKVFERYTGKMYKFSGKNLELTVTGNHRFLLENSKGERSYHTAFELYGDDTILSSGKYKILKTGDWIDIIVNGVDLNESSLNSINQINYIHFNNNTIKITKIDFDDIIACVTVKNGNFLVKVNGKSHWTGNSSIISLQNISHKITKMWWGKGEQENVLYGQLKLIVSRGYINYGVASVIGDKILLYLENNIRLGISSRGVGTLKEINGENLVQNDFELIGFDLVSTPSTPGAYLFPAGKDTVDFAENYVNKNGIYLKENENKIITAIDKFLL